MQTTVNQFMKMRKMKSNWDQALYLICILYSFVYELPHKFSVKQRLITVNRIRAFNIIKI